ncbi:MAG TPA: hypothetical protein VJT72_15275 [Pseudonocardiaceae bacterium]|nr:hypothetical protein [Pseudonocardiaceae bacterium]
MKRSSESEERAQFSVAELLARYGEPAPATGRRRRRAPDDTGTGSVVDTMGQPALEPGWSVRPDLGSVPLPTVGLPRRPGPPPRYSSPSSLGDGRGGEQWTPAVGTSGVGMPVVRAPAVETPNVGAPTVETSAVGRSSVFAGRRPLTATVLPDDRATVQLPRLGPASLDTAPWPGRLAGGGEPPAGLGTVTRAIPAQKVNDRSDDEPAEPAWDAVEEPDDDEPEYSSPVREWAVMVAQIGIGIVGGAALWLICEWLWQRTPVVALVVALAVITGLVWVVRRVRRAEDLQTTVIAVLVGLFVTVSPAALLLVGGR